MNRTERRCIVSSVTAHAALFATLFFMSLWAARHPVMEPSQQIMELVGMPGIKLTEKEGAGGGPPPTVTLQNNHVVLPVDPPPPSRPSPRPPIAVAQDTKPVEPPVKPTPRPHPPINVATDIIKSQDTDDRPTKRPQKDPTPPKKTPRDIQVTQVSTAPKGPTAAELKEQRRREEAEARREAEAEAAATREQKRRFDAWQQGIKSVSEGLKKGLSGETTITTPGFDGSGEAWMGYGTWLKSFYEANWKRPSSLPVPVAYVGVSITVARDGQLVRFEVIERSGIRALDDSVKEVLQRYRTLRPLPEDTKVPERVFKIQFKLEGINS